MSASILVVEDEEPIQILLSYNLESEGYRARHTAGHWVWLGNRGKVVQVNEHGKPARMVGTLMDTAPKVDANKAFDDLLNADMPITSIQQLMGHRWIETTQTYVMANDRQVKADYLAAAQKLEGWA